MHAAGEWFGLDLAGKGNDSPRTRRFLQAVNRSLFLIWNEIGTWGPSWITYIVNQFFYAELTYLRLYELDEKYTLLAISWKP